MVRALILALMLAACTTTPKGSFCAISKPIRLTPEQVDQLTDTQVAEILSHNAKGAALCRWKP